MVYPDFTFLANHFDGPGVDAVVLSGSYARGDAGALSDVDLWRLGKSDEIDARPAGSYLIVGHLVVVSDQSPDQVVQSQRKRAKLWLAYTQPVPSSIGMIALRPYRLEQKHLSGMRPCSRRPMSMPANRWWAGLRKFTKDYKGWSSMTQGVLLQPVLAFLGVSLM
ncbi:nucleotidyltransferase domain-containing protein [Chloroflexi bacterium TSY]|nr:nucleotidyltransferase domain-containing protein [Chloroflexi bacterium TSY]